MLLLVGILVWPLQGWTQAGKTLLDAKIVFSKDGAAQVSYGVRSGSAQDIETNKIETSLVFYALAMNKLGAEGSALMNQVQSIVTRVATEQGMVRADIVKENPLLKPLQAAPVEQTVNLIFASAGGSGHSLEVKPETLDAKFWAPATIYLLQDQVKNLNESGLRLLVLAIGGMNKWYREIGKAADPQSVSQAPSYALNLAVDILQKLGGRKSK
ncbi:MAG TPA: hypothetical protein DF383_06835 [Deltaproteobacteria bacterium]|nr:hypothetical protein [Deltaproteobacteria bacterium]